MNPPTIKTILNQMGARGSGDVLHRTEAQKAKGARQTKTAKQVYAEALAQIGRPATTREIAETSGRAHSAVFGFIRNNPDLFEYEVGKVEGAKKNARRYWMKVDT